jgi:hypothetical protein
MKFCTTADQTTGGQELFLAFSAFLMRNSEWLYGQQSDARQAEATGSTGG